MACSGTSPDDRVMAGRHQHHPATENRVMPESSGGGTGPGSIILGIATAIGVEVLVSVAIRRGKSLPVRSSIPYGRMPDGAEDQERQAPVAVR
jgi:hypothetical protein